MHKMGLWGAGGECDLSFGEGGGDKMAVWRGDILLLSVTVKNKH